MDKTIYNLFIENYKNKFSDEDFEHYLYNISITSRMFSYHFDTLLNGIIRHRDINLKLFKYIYDSDEYDFAESIELFEPICKSLKYPISIRGTEVLSIWENYIKDSYEILEQLYSNLLLFSVKLPEKTTVYRGLYLDPDNDYDFTKMSGFTSTSYDIYTAIHIMISNYDNEDELRNIDNCCLLEIELPKNTDFYSTNMCTIQNEKEIILTREGMLVDRTEDIYTMKGKTWFECLDSNDKIIPTGSSNLKFKRIKSKFKYTNDIQKPNFKSNIIKSLQWGISNEIKLVI